MFEGANLEKYVGLGVLIIVAICGLLLRRHHMRGQARERTEQRSSGIGQERAKEGRQRYRFAYEGLPAIALGDPTDFVRGLRGANAMRRLEALWAYAGEGDEAPVPPIGLSFAVERPAPDLVVALVRPPPPTKVPEAHLVAMIATAPAGLEGGLVDARFLTLEHGRSNDTGASFTILGEWDRSGHHLHHGLGPPVDERAFVAAIVARYRADRGGFIRPMASPPPLSGYAQRDR